MLRLARGGGALNPKPVRHLLAARRLSPLPLHLQRGSLNIASAHKGFGLPSSSSKNKCPCGSGNDYAACCQKLHSLQQLKVSGPEQLLRARFSAYVKRDWKYVLRTTHSANPAQQGSTSANGEIKTTLEQDIKVTMRWADMSNLKIAQVRPGVSPSHAEVDFKYNMKQLFELNTGQPIKDPATKVISETAVFELEDGEWKLLGSQADWDRNKLVMKS